MRSLDRSDVRRGLVLVFVAFVTRLATLGNPILYTDEEFYFSAARAMVNGALPFVDVWDRKPVGLFLIYALPAWLGGSAGIWAYQLAAMISAAATALIIALLARRAGWRRGSTLAGVAYLLWLVFAGGQGGQAPVFYNLPMVLAAWLIAAWGSPRARMRGGLAMLLVGVALQIKYSAVFEGVFFGLWLLLDEWRRRGRVRGVVAFGTLLVGLALLPTAIATLFYLLAGRLPAFVYANFGSILDRDGDPLAEELGNFAKSAAILVPLVAMAVGSLGKAAAGDLRLRGFLRGWLAVALFGFAVLPPWTFHYTLPVLVPGTVLAAGTLERRKLRPFALLLLAAAFIAGQVSLAVNRSRRGTPAQFATLVEAVGHGPGCLYVYSSTSMLYPASGRCAVSPYVFPSHLTRERERHAIGVEQADEIRRIFAAGPAVVVVGAPYEGERAGVRRLAITLLARDYVLSATLPLGRKLLSIYRRERPSPPRATSRFD